MPARAEKKPPMVPSSTALAELTVTHNFTLGRPFAFAFTPDGKSLLYLRSGTEDRRANLYEMEVSTGEERLLLSVDSLLGGVEEKLSVEEKAERERKRIKLGGFTSYDLSKDGEWVAVKTSGKVWIYERATGRSAQLDIPAGVVLDPRLSPDRKRIAFVRDSNLYVMKLGDFPDKKPKKGPVIWKGRITALTKDGTELETRGTAEFVAQEEMARFAGYWWAPDGKRIVYQSTDVRHLEKLTIADASTPERAANVFPYPRAGQDNAAVRLFVIATNGRGRRELQWDHDRWPYVARVSWSKNAPPAVLVQSRDQRSQVYLRADPESGRTVAMHEESDEAWLNLSKSTPQWLPDGKSYLWATEASGGWAIARHYPRLSAAKSGLKQKVEIVPPDAGFHALVHVDVDRGFVWFEGGSNPVELLLYRVPLAGGPVEAVTSAGGEDAVVFSRDGSAFVVTRVTLTEMPRSSVHGVEGLSLPLTPNAPEHRFVPEVADEPKKKPKVELVGPDRAGGFHAAITRPNGFDPKQKYPIILYVYGGPGFNVVHSAMPNYFVQQWMADHGFVVISIDGRGTPRRGRTFERAVRGKFAEVPLEDQVAGLEALGQNYPELDMERVGVYGWSFGGYMAALSVLRRPDVFKVAVSGAPVVDWLYYDTHYTERYLGLPAEAADAYTQSNLLTYAKKLDRPLLLVHGIADDNVYFAHSLQLADALFRAGKHYELLPLVGLTHQVADPKVREVLYQRMVDFLGQTLW